MTRPGAWTVAQANAALPDVRALLEKGRQHVAAMEHLETQLTDLRIIWGDAVLAVACPGHAEFAQYHEAFEQHRGALHEVLLRFHALGVEVKDIAGGLVDFRGHIGDVPAYLCWKDGEASVSHWHPLEGGFAARRPLP